MKSKSSSKSKKTIKTTLSVTSRPTTSTIESVSIPVKSS